VRVFVPSNAAPVRIKPRIGPAHGAQSKPVAIPSRNDRKLPGLESESGESARLLPNLTNGREIQSATVGSKSVTPKSAKTTSEAARPY
jgi:hypothetical protein